MTQRRRVCGVFAVSAPRPTCCDSNLTFGFCTRSPSVSSPSPRNSAPFHTFTALCVLVAPHYLPLLPPLDRGVSCACVLARSRTPAPRILDMPLFSATSPPTEEKKIDNGILICKSCLCIQRPRSLPLASFFVLSPTPPPSPPCATPPPLSASCPPSNGVHSPLFSFPWRRSPSTPQTQTCSFPPPFNTPPPR